MHPHPGACHSTKRPVVELADIVRVHAAALGQSYALSPHQHAVLRAIALCRTAALGGHLDVCPQCGWSQPAYNSCRNRHCPKCQNLAQARWTEARVEQTLPTHHFHVVFTLPAELRPLAQRNPKLVYNMLFACASQTLLELGRDPEQLGAQLGITMVLHTWCRKLNLHPHVHCIVTGGGLSGDEQRWIPTKPDFLFPVEVMGALFRGKFLAALGSANDSGKLTLGPKDEPQDPEAFDRLVDRLYHKPWVVYCKRPMAGAEQVVRYLGRYTHRVAISNARLVAMDERGVTFRTKNGKAVVLEPVEFLRRFLLHVLPSGFTKIRHYGLMASGKAKLKREVARTLLTQSAPETFPDGLAQTRPLTPKREDWSSLACRLTGNDPRLCPSCRSAMLVRSPLPDPTIRAPPVARAA